MGKKRSTTEDELDMTGGLYRRVYAGFIKGRRINNVSLDAEAWFWRVNAIADDFGNADADPMLIYTATVGRRSGVSAEAVAKLLREMEAEDLIRFFEVDGERYLHIVGFGTRQPAPRNGRRIRRVPASPWDDGGNGPVGRHGGREGTSGGIRGNAGDSDTVKPQVESQHEPTANGVIPGNPGESGGYHTHSQDHTHTQSQLKLAAPSSAEPASPTSPVTVEPPLLTFSCVGGKKGKSPSWDFTQSHADELTEAFPGLDVLAEVRKALTWTKAKPSNRKTANGMKQFLFGWMTRAHNRGGNRAPLFSPGADQRKSWHDIDQDRIASAIAEVGAES